VSEEARLAWSAFTFRSRANLRVLAEAANKHQNMKVSIMGVGRSGAGKSTVGNFFLNGGTSASGKLFETSAGAESCTKGVNIRSSGERMYFDVPGIPDTSASETKGHYDTIVKTVKQEPISALLFVFKYEKIDEKAFQMAEILFRELKKANCLHLLVINDHNSYLFNPPPSEEEYANLKEKIQHSTKIQFDHAWNATSVSLRKTVDEIHDYVQGLSVDPKPSPHLKDFDELRKHLKRRPFEPILFRHKMRVICCGGTKLQAARDSQAAIEDYKKAKQHFNELQGILVTKNSLEAHN
jgi:GTPase Era involved in 16S rRNA processing